jgi:hypothetical protein
MSVVAGPAPLSPRIPGPTRSRGIIADSSSQRPRRSPPLLRTSSLSGRPDAVSCRWLAVLSEMDMLMPEFDLVSHCFEGSLGHVGESILMSPDPRVFCALLSEPATEADVGVGGLGFCFRPGSGKVNFEVRPMATIGGAQPGSFLGSIRPPLPQLWYPGRGSSDYS